MRKRGRLFYLLWGSKWSVVGSGDVERCGIVFHAVAGMVECVGFIPSFDSSALYLVGVRKFVGPCV